MIYMFIYVNNCQDFVGFTMINDSYFPKKNGLKQSIMLCDHNFNVSVTNRTSSKSLFYTLLPLLEFNGSKTVTSALLKRV